MNQPLYLDLSPLREKEVFVHIPVHANYAFSVNSLQLPTGTTRTPVENFKELILRVYLHFTLLPGKSTPVHYVEV